MEWISKIKAFYHRKLDGYSFEEYLIMFVTCSIFLPYFCSIAAVLFTLCYLIFTHQLSAIISGHRMLSLPLPSVFFPLLYLHFMTTESEWFSHWAC